MIQYYCLAAKLLLKTIDGTHQETTVHFDTRSPQKAS